MQFFLRIFLRSTPYQEKQNFNYLRRMQLFPLRDRSLVGDHNKNR